MKRLFVLSFFAVPSICGMEERSAAPRDESLVKALYQLACAAYRQDDVGAMASMQAVEKRLAEESPADLLSLLKHNGTYTHVKNLSKNGISTSVRADLLKKFGALLLKAAGGDSAVLDDGLCCVRCALDSRLLPVESMGQACDLQREIQKLLDTKRASPKNSVLSNNIVAPNADTKKDELLQEKVKPLTFLTKERPSFPGRQLPTRRKAVALTDKKNGEMSLDEVAKNTNKHKKNKKKKADEPHTNETWDCTVMRCLGKLPSSYQENIEYLSNPDTCCTVSDSSRKKRLFDEMRGLMAAYHKQATVEKNQKTSIDDLLLEGQQASYVIGRLLLENAGSNAVYQQYGQDIPFQLIHAAAESGYTPAQFYLATSEKTGLTKSQCILYLMDTFKEELTEGEKGKVWEVANGYVREGYFLPLLFCVARKLDLGTLDIYLDALEKAFPPVHFYDVDELVSSKLDVESMKSERWSAQAIRSAMQIMRNLVAIESSKEKDVDELLKEMSGEVDKIEKLSREHPKVATLCGSCYSLLGRAYGCCGKMELSLAAHEKAVKNGGYHETTLMNYIQFCLHLINNASPLAKQKEEIGKYIENLLNRAENYKVFGYLLYAAFHSHYKRFDAAECFMKKAQEQMEREHARDERMKSFLESVNNEIQKNKNKKKRTVQEVKKDKERLKERVKDGLHNAFHAITLADQKAKVDPLNAIGYVRQAAFTQNLFEMLHIDENLRMRYNGVIKKIEQAKDLSGAECKKQVEIVLQELKEKQQRIDEQCKMNSVAEVKVIPLSQKRGL